LLSTKIEHFEPTGGNADVFQNFAQTEPEFSEMSTQTEPEMMDIGTDVMSMTQTVDSFMDGQEQTGLNGAEDRQEFTIEKGSTETMYQCIIDPEISQQSSLGLLLPIQQSSETQFQFVQELSRDPVQEPQNLFTQIVTVPRLDVRR
jgi:hypothetical protein